MSEFFCDSLPPMDCEDASPVESVDSTECDESPKLCGETVKPPPTPPPEPGFGSSLSSAPLLQQQQHISLIEEIKNKQQQHHQKRMDAPESYLDGGERPPLEREPSEGSTEQTVGPQTSDEQNDELENRAQDEQLASNMGVLSESKAEGEIEINDSVDNVCKDYDGDIQLHCDLSNNAGQDDKENCDTRSNMEDLESLQLNLGSLKSRFEKQASEEGVKKSQSVADRGALSRSASVLKRLEKYQSAVAGGTKGDSSDEEGGDDDMTRIDLSKQIEVCKEMNELKNKWESGQVTKDAKETHKFFENFKEGPTSRKEFKMTPPREMEKENSPNPVCERNPDVVVSSTTIDDIPKVDTATKMRQKFQQLCESSSEKAPPSEVQRPKPMKRITPPRETFQGNVVENTPVVDPDVVKCSYKVDDDIQVETDMAKSMRARFENWTDVEQRKNSANLEDECLPVDNITRNMKAVFEANTNKKPQTNGQPQERNKTKVNRFVQFGTPDSEVCAMCNGKVFPMERREASGLVMHTRCFKCTHCNINLRLDGYSQTAGKLYCEAHYTQLFRVKGNYDEGFGREKWSRTPSPSTQDSPPLNIASNSLEENIVA